MSFSAPIFQTWPLGRNKAVINWIIAQFFFFKLISISHTYIYFFLLWNWNDIYVHTLPYFSRKPYPIPDQNGLSVYPFSCHNGVKTLPAGAANTGIHQANCATHANDYALDWRCETGERSPLAARVRACTRSPQKFKYQHLWRNPIKRIRKYSNDLRDAIYARQHIHSRFTYTLLYEIYCGLRKF